jgi:Flp pilus assembly protein TadG
MIKKLREEQGSALVLLAIFIIALMGFAAISIDVGNVYTHRRYMNEAADAAALAAVPDWATGRSAAQVVTIGTQFAQANGLKTNEIVSVIPGVWNASAKTFVPNVSVFKANAVPAVQVIARRSVSTPFWRVLSFGGQTAMSPRVESIAIAGRANAVAAALPWAACNALGTPAKCTVITIKNGGVCDGSGNFGALNLVAGGGSGGGASTYEENILNGYQGIVRVGDTFQTKTGNMAGPTKKALEDRVAGLPRYVCSATSGPPNNKRMAIIPVTTDLGNGSSPVTIMGFWTVALGDPNGKGEVDVTFIEVFSGTEVDPTAPPVVGQPNGVALVK